MIHRASDFDNIDRIEEDDDSYKFYGNELKTVVTDALKEYGLTYTVTVDEVIRNMPKTNYYANVDKAFEAVDKAIMKTGKWL